MRAQARLLVCAALVLHFSPIAIGRAWSQSTDDSFLEYCYGSVCHPTKEEAIAEMEAANPAGYAGKFVEIKSELSFQSGRPRPLSITFNVEPEGPIDVMSSTYGTLAASPAPFYCAPSGEVAYPNLCGSEGELVQGIIDRETAAYVRAKNRFEVNDGHVPDFMTVLAAPSGSSPQLGVYLQSWDENARRPTVTVWQVDENDAPTGPSSSFYITRYTAFQCAPDFYPKAGTNPVHKPNASNPTAPGTECRPAIDDQTITTRLRQTTCLSQGGTPKEGNPCSPATGDKSQQETDFEFAGRSFGRAYHSLGQVEQRKSLAPRWVHSYSDRIFGNPGNLSGPLHHFNDRGEIDVFVRQGNTNRFLSESSASKVLDVEAGNVYKLTSQDGIVRRFDAAGRLVGIEEIGAAWRIAFAYEGDLLKTATDYTGRQLKFEYLNGRLSTLRLPDNTTVVYGYDPDGNLNSVQYPDGRTRSYHYNEAGLSDANDVHALTGISDNGQRYASFGYDQKNRGRLTQHHADGLIVDRVQLVYGANGVVNVTGSRSETRAYAIANESGYRRATTVTNANGSIFNTYTGALPLQSTDRLGNVTRHEYTDGYESARIEAFGTADERKIATVRNAAYRVTSRTISAKVGGSYVPKQQTTYAYNSRGQVTGVTVTDPSATPALSRTTTTTYCEQPGIDAGACPLLGLVASIDGPGHGPDDVMTYQYRMADDPTCASQGGACAWRKGDLWKVVNPLTQTAETLRRDRNARPLSVRDANGVTTDFEYDAAGRLTARKTRGTNDAGEADDRIMRMTYWPGGEIKRITQSDGTWAQYSYDSAHRLTGVADHIGNTMTYTLDAAGERSGEETRDPAGSLRRTLTRLYNTLGQLESQTDAYQHVTGFTYDNNGNLDKTRDALLHETDNDYDALGRLKRTLQNATGGQANTVETKFEYDALDNLTKVIDPNQLSTHYTYNGLGELKNMLSPDTGNTSYIYDPAGNRQSQTDARGVQTQYAYDALDRITAVAYPSDSSLNAAYVYDTAQPDCAAGETFLTGRLAKMTDHSGSTAYCYDRFGQLTRKTQRTQGKTFSLRWQYAANGRLQAMTYPDGSVVDYLYDAQGRMVDMGVTLEGQRRKVAYDVLYHPWGGPARWRSMADRMVVRTQNQNGQPGIVQAQDAAEVPIAGISLGYEFDAVGNLKRLRDGNQADPPARIYGYDPLNRLTEAKDASDVVWQSYNYDKTGNRQTAGWRELVAQEDCTGAPPGGPCTPLPPAAQWSTDAYTYHPGTHRLFSRTGRERSYDSAGNLTLDSPMGAAPIDPPPGGGGTESAAYEGTMQAMEEGGETPPPGAVSRTYSYSAANRMSGTSLGGEFLMGYRYNGRGERVYRQGADRTVHTVFDDAGRWIGDYDANGAIVQQAIWLGDLPVGLLTKDGGVTRLFHIEADALGSPRIVINPTRGARGTVVWRWDLAGEAFGNDKPTEDPDGDDIAFVLDMRYPGQQYDSASGLNYNYFRDYEAAMGRYSQSDPIGLEGDISTYGYVGGNPMIAVDPMGLQSVLRLRPTTLPAGPYSPGYPVPGASGGRYDDDGLIRRNSSPASGSGNVIPFPSRRVEASDTNCPPDDGDDDRCRKKQKVLLGKQLTLHLLWTQGRIPISQFRSAATIFNIEAQGHNWDCPKHTVALFTLPGPTR